MERTLTIQPGDLEIEVQEGETILEAGLRRGLNLPHSCRSGSCMACMASLRKGEVIYPHGPPLGLGEAEQAAGKLLMCQAELVRSSEIETVLVSSADLAPLKRLPCRIERLEKLCHDVMAIYVKLPPVGPLPFRAGQYIDFLLENGDHRSFSMANPPHDAGLLELHVRRVPGGSFSRQVFEEFQVKDLLRLLGPLGNFYVRHDAQRPLLMVAGGTGFAPIQSMLLDLVHRQDKRPVTLYWGVRSRRDLYREALILELVRQHPSLDYIPVLSEPRPEDDWQGRTGLVHAAVLEDFASLGQFDVYLSGPPPMIDAARDEFAGLALVEERLYFDAFEYSPRVQAAIEASSED